jgi:protein tyrosine kinase modulator
MIKPPQGMISPDEIFKIIIHRRWFIIIPFCLSMIVGSYLALTMQKIFEASTLILVEPQRVPTNYVRPIVSMDISSRLRTISEQVLSRTNIERIISTYKLFTKPDQASMFIEDKIATVRNRINVDVKESRTFSISFQGTDPEKVKNIANALASFFIDENLKDREQEAIGTSTFLDDELQSMRNKLEKSEDRLRKFRQMYMGALPDQLQTNLNMLASYDAQLLDKQKALRDAKERLDQAAKQMSETSSMQSSLAGLDDAAFSDSGAGGNAELESLKAKLAQLKTRYTDSYPDVLRLKNMIVKLEADEKKAAKATKADTDTPQIDYKALQKAQLAENHQQVKTLAATVAQLQKKIAEYQERVENTPKRQEQMLSIKRDYDNLKNIYNSLLNRKLEAEISVNMEKKQKGEQFRIIDPARLPEKPISPNMKRIFMMAIAVWLICSGGIVFLLEFLNTSYRSKEDLEATLKIPVLASVPRILQPKEMRFRKLEQVFTFVSLGCSIGLFACFAIITSEGPEKIVAYVKTMI